MFFRGAATCLGSASTEVVTQRACSSRGLGNLSSGSPPRRPAIPVTRSLASRSTAIEDACFARGGPTNPSAVARRAQAGLFRPSLRLARPILSSRAAAARMSARHA